MKYTATQLMNLRDELHHWQQASDWHLCEAREASPVAVQKVKRKREQCDRVFEAFIEADELGFDMETEQQAIRSVAAMLFPLMFRWLLTALAREIIIWLWHRTNREVRIAGIS